MTRFNSSSFSDGLALYFAINEGRILESDELASPLADKMMEQLGDDLASSLAESGRDSLRNLAVLCDTSELNQVVDEMMEEAEA